MAKGSTGMPISSTTTARNTPIRIRPHGRLPFIIPSMTIFISVACGAPSSCVPKPQALSSKYSVAPMASAEAITPMISPICCFLGVAPSK